MKYFYKIIRVIFVILGVGLSAMAGRPLPLWRLLPALLCCFLAIGSSGCARLTYSQQGVNVSGMTVSPEAAIHATAGAEIMRAEAYAIRRCADDPRTCGGMWGYGGLDMPAGYTMAGMQAAGAPTQQTNETVEIRKDIKRLKKSQELLIEAVRADRKNSKRAKGAQ